MRSIVLLGAIAAVLAAPSWAAAWSWPAEGAVLRPFLLGDDPYAGGQHRGVDVAAADAEPVHAPAAGTVTFAGTVPRHGKTVSILTGDGLSVTLTHLGGIRVVEG
ncbi:MAG: M23 family metallopeptidase, partial [Thermoleophilia bacterium]|nr:M23 family metallopeptidase [Thermoleophilia bacterium]